MLGTKYGLGALASDVTENPQGAPAMPAGMQFKSFGAETPNSLAILSGQLQRGFPTLDVNAMLQNFGATQRMPLLTRPSEYGQYADYLKKHDAWVAAGMPAGGTAAPASSSTRYSSRLGLQPINYGTYLGVFNNGGPDR
jgi:hypothetical protein